MLRQEPACGLNAHGGAGFDNFRLGNGANVAYLGAGNEVVTGGATSNLYHIAAGTGARTTEVTNFVSGRDSYDFSGFSGSAVASQSVSNGSLTMRSRTAHEYYSTV